MASVSKRKKLAREKVDPNSHYPIDEALTMVKELATAKFPESIDVSVNLGVDPRKSDQVVRSSTVLAKQFESQFSLRVRMPRKRKKLARTLLASKISPSQLRAAK